jgi:hypothetical protein
MAIAPKDAVTERIDAFLAKNSIALVETSHRSALGFREPRIILPFGEVSRSKATAEHNLALLAHDMERLCEQHDFARFLLLFRKMPYQLALSLLKVLTCSESSFTPIYEEAVLGGTNYILQFCRHGPTFKSNNERYKFLPENKELWDAALLFLLSVIQRRELFGLNSINRRDLVTPIALDALLDVYNRRLDKRWSPRIGDKGGPVILLPAMANTVPVDARIWHGRDREGTDRVLLMRNHIPVPCDAEHEFDRYPYLDTEDFERLSGIPFKKFRRVWVGLNEVLIYILPMYWSERYAAQVPPEFFAAKLEQADDYCETALGVASLEVISTACYDTLARDDSGEPPSLD